MKADLFGELVHRLKARKDRHGEMHITCPLCGSESTPAHPKCSFNERGWHCFVCGAGGSLKNLAEKSDLQFLENTFTNRPQNTPKRPQEAPGRPQRWKAISEYLCSEFEASDGRFDAWLNYKPVSYANILAKRLGLGILPASRCHHPRLIVPIITDRIVGFRGRQIACDCGKWLAPGGSDIENEYPLYNAEALKPGCVVWIVENPIDALLVGQSTDYIGVATYSVAYWFDRWTGVLKAARPSLVVVAYDNDIPGNGGGRKRERMIGEWMTAHPGARKAPDPAGPRLANRLLAAGLNAVLFNWDRMPQVKDIGVLLQSAPAF